MVGFNHRWFRWNKTCASCRKRKELHAKGLCQECYNRSEKHRLGQEAYAKTDRYYVAMAKVYLRKMSPSARRKLVRLLGA